MGRARPVQPTEGMSFGLWGWKRILLGAAPGVTATALAAPTTGALVAGQAAELRVFGHPLVFLRVTAVANSASTTNMKVLVRGGAPRAKTRRN